MKMYNPAHPGRILAASFDENFTVEDAARKMGVSVQSLTDVIDGKASITPELAFLLATIFPWDTPELWLGMQANYDSWQATHNRQWQKQVLQKHNIAPNFLDNAFKAQLSM